MKINIDNEREAAIEAINEQIVIDETDAFEGDGDVPNGLHHFRERWLRDSCVKIDVDGAAVVFRELNGETDGFEWYAKHISTVGNKAEYELSERI
jgi:hypothetical protein